MNNAHDAVNGFQAGKVNQTVVLHHKTQAGHAMGYRTDISQATQLTDDSL